MTLKVIHRLQTFSNAICRTFVQHFTRFQLTMGGASGVAVGAAALCAMALATPAAPIVSDRLLKCPLHLHLIVFRPTDLLN